MRVFGKPQAYRVDFTQIGQPWLREMAKQWAREQAPLVRAASTRRAVASIGELSRSLHRRDDHGEHPTVLGREDISLFLARVTRAHSAGKLSAHKRSVLVADVSYFLRQARDLELGAEGRPVFGLPASFTLSREEVRRVARIPAPPPARALPDTVVAQLLDLDALALLEQMHGERVRIAVELLADTGRRPNEICILTWDCLDHDSQVDERGQPSKLAVLVHDMPKVARTGCWLPIDDQTAELIATQKRRMRERYPDTAVGELRLFPRLHRNPRGTKPMDPGDLARVMRRWVDALPALLDGDGQPFDRSRMVPYAFRHSYAQRHADNGTPVEVLRELMGHRSIATTQGYFKVRDERARQAVQTLRRCRSTATATAP
jgi:integrase